MRFTRADYDRMVEVGILGKDDPVELLDGEIVTMPPMGSAHNGVTNKLAHLFISRIGDRFICSVQGPNALSDVSEPEPDLQILQWRDDFYASGHPGPKDVVLLIEVAQSSIDRDRETKMRLYAEAGITEYWVIDVDQRTVIIHRQPQGAAYRTVEHAETGATITPEALADCEVDLAWLFG